MPQDWNLKKWKESTMQSRIMQMLSNQGWLVVKVIQTNMNGWPDLMCLKDGKTFFIEVKTSRGKLSPLQQYRHEELKKRGFNVFTLYDLKNVESIAVNNRPDLP